MSTIKDGTIHKRSNFHYLNHCDATHDIFVRMIKEKNLYLMRYKIPKSSSWVASGEKSSFTYSAFQAILNEHLIDGPIVIGGEFNACATHWHSKYTNIRGRSILESFDPLKVELLKDGKRITFNIGRKDSIIQGGPK